MRGRYRFLAAGVDALRIPGVDEVNASDYFLFQSLSAFSPQVLGELKSVSVPEPGSLLLAAFGSLGLAMMTTVARRRIANRTLSRDAH